MDASIGSRIQAATLSKYAYLPQGLKSGARRRMLGPCMTAPLLPGCDLGPAFVPPSSKAGRLLHFIGISSGGSKPPSTAS